jgi:hypothetical protein
MAITGAGGQLADGFAHGGHEGALEPGVLVGELGAFHVVQVVRGELGDHLAGDLQQLVAVLGVLEAVHRAAGDGFEQEAAALAAGVGVEGQREVFADAGDEVEAQRAEGHALPRPVAGELGAGEEHRGEVARRALCTLRSSSRAKKALIWPLPAATMVRSDSAAIFSRSATDTAWMTSLPPRRGTPAASGRTWCAGRGPGPAGRPGGPAR